MLSDLTVIDFSQGVAGSLAALRLGDLGAKVIKIEVEPGDWTRDCLPLMPDGETSAVFFGLNRGKRALAVGPNPGAAEAALRKLVAQADVVITDRATEELGLVGLGGLEEDPCPLGSRLIVASPSSARNR